MPTPIERLPTEVLDLITNELILSEFSSFRLSCRAVYLSSLHSFGTRFFSSWICFTRPKSLGELLDISKHEEFSTRVTSLHLMVPWIWSEDQLAIARETCAAPPLTPPTRYNRARWQIKQDEIERHTATLASHEFCQRLLQPDDGRDVHRETLFKTFAGAFDNFSNLRNIYFFQEERNHGHTIMTYRKSACIDFVSHYFQQLLKAITHSSLRLYKLKSANSVEPRIYSRSGTITPHSTFDLDAAFLTMLKTSFAELRSLQLWISASYHGHSRRLGWENGIINFLNAAPALESLNLHLDIFSQGSRYSRKIIHSMADKVTLPRLRKLHLTGTQFDEEDITKFLIRHKATIRIVYFNNTRMQHGTWCSMLETIRDALQLKSIHLIYPLQRDDRITFPWADDMWCRYLDVDYQQHDDDEEETMHAKITKVIESLEVGFEQNGELGSDFDYDSDNPKRREEAHARLYRHDSDSDW